MTGNGLPVSIAAFSWVLQPRSSGLRLPTPCWGLGRLRSSYTCGKYRWPRCWQGCAVAVPPGAQLLVQIMLIVIMCLQPSVIRPNFRVALVISPAGPSQPGTRSRGRYGVPQNQHQCPSCLQNTVSPLRYPGYSLPQIKVLKCQSHRRHFL